MSAAQARFAAVALLVAALVLGINGMGRSLWLDEAWVANSINAPTLGQMFYYPNWLQSSPPLFLVASRSAVRLLGLSNISLRTVPLIMALIATAAFLATASRLLPPPFAILAGCLLVFFTAEVEYSHTAKQYSSEVAMFSLLLWAMVSYLQDPDDKRFKWLMAVVAIALPFSYPAVFLLPAIIVAVDWTGVHSARRVIILAATILAIMYLVFIRPNMAPGLRQYWASDTETRFSRGTLIALGVAVAVTAINRNWTQILCLTPCLLFAAAAALHWYPLSYRTRLFVVPGFMLMVTMAAEKICRFIFSRHSTVNGVAWILIAATVVLGVRSQMLADPNLPKEDVDNAVRFLQTAVSPEDLLLVHPSVGETFRLYADMHHWQSPPVIYGDTGWPCCPRGKDARPGSSAQDAITHDLRRMIPAGYSGLVWLLYTIRPTHWDWVGLDESRIWRGYLAGHGCEVSRPNRRYENLAITVAQCAPFR